MGLGVPHFDPFPKKEPQIEIDAFKPLDDPVKPVEVEFASLGWPVSWPSTWICLKNEAS